MVDQAAASVLSNHELLMASPAASKLTSFYPTASESECTIAQAVCNSGQLFIQGNAKQIGGSTDFMVSTPNIMDCLQLLLSIKVPAANGGQKIVPLGTDPGQVDQARDLREDVFMCTPRDGWGFDAIDRLEVSFANSNISNLQIQGHAMRDWSLLQCKNADEREQMLKIAGKAECFNRTKEVELKAAIPISFLFLRGAGGVKGGFGIDGRVLNGPITFQFHFKPIQYFLSPVASIYDRPSFTAVNLDQAKPFDPENVDFPDTLGAQWPASPAFTQDLPSQFSTLELTMRTYQLMDGTFSVSKALEANPSLIYSIPSLWMNTYSQQVVLDSNGRGEININSIPAGMVQAIIARIRPVNNTQYKSSYAVPSIILTNPGSTDPPKYGYADEAIANADCDMVGDYQSRLNYEPPNYFVGQNQRGQASSGVNQNVGGKPFNTQTGVTSAYRPYVPWSLPLKSVQLQYSGQNIYFARNRESHDGFTRAIFQDDLKTKVCGMPLTLSNILQEGEIFRTDDPRLNPRCFPINCEKNNAMVQHDTQCIVIPLMHDGNSIFRHRAFENLPHYSGSTLQLQFTVEKYNTYTSDATDRVECWPNGSQYSNYNFIQTAQRRSNINTQLDYKTWKPEQIASSCSHYPSNRLQHVALCRGASVPVENSQAPACDLNCECVIFNNNPSSEGAVAYSAENSGPEGAGKVQVDLTYVIASLFQVTNGVAELQL